MSSRSHIQFDAKINRNQVGVTNILSSLGPLRETNISGLLGYLIHLNPRVVQLLIGKEIVFETVELELRSEDQVDRYDIYLSSPKNQFVIEIKIDGHDAKQLKRYSKKNRNLITIGSRLHSHRMDKSFSKNFYDWNQVVHALERAKSKGRDANHFYNSLVDDFIVHLRENNMIKGRLEDVYLRDLSGESVEIYFNHGIYHFQPKFFDSAKNARYFAPYLTGSNNKAARLSVFRTLGIGISFVSKIQSSMLGTETEFWGHLTDLGYSREDKQFIFDSFKWKPTSKREHAVLFLGSPMRLFQRPVTKYDLWKIAGGAMPPMSIDFGDLIAASNGLFPLSRKNQKKTKKNK